MNYPISTDRECGSVFQMFIATSGKLLPTTGCTRRLAEPEFAGRIGKQSALVVRTTDWMTLRQGRYDPDLGGTP
jgi:hypothetical protein